MKREVVMCDWDNGNCRAMSDGTCSVCDGDFCKDHARYLQLVALTDEQARSPDTATMAKVDCVLTPNITHVSMCTACVREFARNGGGPRGPSANIEADTYKDLFSGMMEGLKAISTERQLAREAGENVEDDIPF